MSITYPGVYIEEPPSGVHAITAVTTSVTAFIGFTPRGPLETPTTLTSFADFERKFGGLSTSSVLSYAVQHFFLNGGSVAIVVRLASGARHATGTINREEGTALAITADDPGTWGDMLRVAIDASTAAAGSFNLRVFDLAGAVSESYQNLSMKATDPHFVESIVNPASALITVKAEGTTPPDPSGTVSKAFPDPLPDLAKQVTVTIGSTTSPPFAVYDPDKDGTAPTTMGQLSVLLERKIRQQGGPFGGVRVTAVGRTLQAVAGPDDIVHFGLTGASDLGLEATANPGAHPLAGGADGTPPGGATSSAAPTRRPG